jgi:hypothetical protein
MHFVLRFLFHIYRQELRACPCIYRFCGTGRPNRLPRCSGAHSPTRHLLISRTHICTFTPIVIIRSAITYTAMRVCKHFRVVQHNLIQAFYACSAVTLTFAWCFITFVARRRRRCHTIRACAVCRTALYRHTIRACTVYRAKNQHTFRTYAIYKTTLFCTDTEWLGVENTVRGNYSSSHIAVHLQLISAQIQLVASVNFNTVCMPYYKVTGAVAYRFSRRYVITAHLSINNYSVTIYFDAVHNRIGHVEYRLQGCVPAAFLPSAIPVPTCDGSGVYTVLTVYTRECEKCSVSHGISDIF